MVGLCASAPLRSKGRVGGLGDDLRVLVSLWLRRGWVWLCALIVFSVPLWFDRLLESISVNDPEVAMSRSRRRLTTPVAAL